MNISFGNKYKNHGESQIRGDGFPACQGTVPSLPGDSPVAGSYRYDGYSSKNGRSINNIAIDSKSITSLGYHIPLLNNHRRNQRKAFGTTCQFYIWRSKK